MSKERKRVLILGLFLLFLVVMFFTRRLFPTNADISPSIQNAVEASMAAATPPDILPCLLQDPERDLSFLDNRIIDAETRDALQLLQSSYLEKGYKGQRQYIVSGIGSQANNQGYYDIGLDQPLTRLQWAKMLMTARCQPILTTASVIDQSIRKGVAVRPYADMPIERSSTEQPWEHDVMYSATYYRLVRGDGENRARPHDVLSVAEMVAMLLRSSGTEAPAAQLPQAWYTADIQRFREIYPDLVRFVHLDAPERRLSRGAAFNILAGVLKGLGMN